MVNEIQQESPNLKACLFSVANIVGFVPAYTLSMNVDASNGLLFIGTALITTLMLVPFGVSFWILVKTSIASTTTLVVRGILWLFLGVAWVPFAFFLVSTWVSRIYPPPGIMYLEHVQLMLNEVF